MKKVYIFAAAVLALAACAKEADQAVQVSSKSTPISITVTLDEQTKTAYEGEKTFSWVAGDIIGLKVKKTADGTYDIISLSTEDSGTTATFTGTLPDGYESCDVALYPKPASKTEYYSSGLGVQEDGTIRMWGTILPDLANPMASIPLIGRPDTNGDYKFSTACGILKVTVENIPSDAYFFQLDAPNGTALNGNYEIGDDNVITMANISGTPWPQKYVYFTPEADKETRTFYIPIPVGTIPAGTVASISSSAKGTVALATTTSDITIRRNKIVNVGTLTYPTAKTYSVSEVVGTYSVDYEDYWGATGTTSITIAASDDSTKGTIMITEFAGHTVGDAASCAYTYGTINEDQMVFAATKTVTPFYIDANGADHVLANYSGDDVVFVIDEPGKFHSGIWIVGNRWHLGDSNGFDTFWTTYVATRQ